MKDYSQKPNRDDCNLGCRLRKRLLGQILVDGEFISTGDLDAAIDQQKHTNELLGQILVRMGVLVPKELQAVLFVQEDFAFLKDTVKAAAGLRKLLGELLIQARRITPEQLELALSKQLASNEKLGEVLVRLGLISERELDAVLAFQRHQGREVAGSEQFRLGQILVATDHITREQLEDALVKQKISKKKIGEVLVEAGYAESHHIQFGLNLQCKLVTAALIAALSLASTEGADVAHATESTGTSRARVTVTARVLAHTSIKFLYQAPELVVTNADISRGYVEIHDASRIELKNNNPDGYMLVFEGTNGQVNLVKEIQVQGLGREVQIDQYGGWIVLPNEGLAPVTKELSYRFVLSEKAQPGSYMWPLTLSVRPMQ